MTSRALFRTGLALRMAVSAVAGLCTAIAFSVSVGVVVHNGESGENAGSYSVVLADNTGPHGEPEDGGDVADDNTGPHGGTTVNDDNTGPHGRSVPGDLV